MIAFFSCFVNAFTKLFACGTRQRRNEATPKREPIVAESLAPPLAPENSEETASDLITEPDPVSIRIKRSRSPRNAAEANIASVEEIKLKVDSETSPESVRESLGILADHPFGCPDREETPRPLQIVARAETRLSLGSTSTADSIPQLVEASTPVEASTSATSSRTSRISAAASGRGGQKRRKNQLEKLKEKYRLKVDKAKREWELAQFKADEARRKMKIAAAKAEAALDKMRKKEAAKKEKASAKKILPKKNRDVDSRKPPVPTDSGLCVDPSTSGIEAESNQSNPLGRLPQIPREWGVFHLRRGQRSDANAEELEITDIE